MDTHRVIRTETEGWKFEQIFKKLGDIIAGKKFGTIEELENEIKKYFDTGNLGTKNIDLDREVTFILNVVLGGKPTRVKIILTEGENPVFKKIELLK